MTRIIIIALLLICTITSFSQNDGIKNQLDSLLSQYRTRIDKKLQENHFEDIKLMYVVVILNDEKNDNQIEMSINCTSDISRLNEISPTFVMNHRGRNIYVRASILLSENIIKNLGLKEFSRSNRYYDLEEMYNNDTTFSHDYFYSFYLKFNNNVLVKKRIVPTDRLCCKLSIYEYQDMLPH